MSVPVSARPAVFAPQTLDQSFGLDPTGCGTVFYTKRFRVTP